MSTAPPNEKELPLDPKYDHYDFPLVAAAPQKGHAGYTTEIEDAQVNQLRMMLESRGLTENLDTLTLLRFLRARKFDVKLAEKMFVECAQWRKTFGGGVDNLTRTFDYPEKKEVSKYYPQYYHKTDKDGRPVYIEHLGKIDLNALQKITTNDRMLQHLVVEYEKLADPRLPACSRKSGHLLETCCTIMDMKGVSLSSASSVYGYLQQASGVSQNYYPERLGKLYVINAPWGFSGIFAVVKKFLDPVTVAKIHILGSGYKSDLLKQISEENLPKELGGTCECEGGCMFSDLGPWRDPQWTKPAKWEKPLADDKGAIETPGAITSDGENGNPAGAEAKQPVTQPAEGGQPAPAAQ